MRSWRKHLRGKSCSDPGLRFPLSLSVALGREEAGEFYAKIQRCPPKPRIPLGLSKQWPLRSSAPWWGRQALASLLSGMKNWASFLSIHSAVQGSLPPLALCLHLSALHGSAGVSVSLGLYLYLSHSLSLCVSLSLSPLFLSLCFTSISLQILSFSLQRKKSENSCKKTQTIATHITQSFFGGGAQDAKGKKNP